MRNVQPNAGPDNPVQPYTPEDFKSKSGLGVIHLFKYNKSATFKNVTLVNVKMHTLFLMFKNHLTS